MVTSFLVKLFNCDRILKIFFDGRRDNTGLHSNIGVCSNNVYDLQAVHMMINSLNKVEKETPGLNDTLDAFHASHGKNYLKERMHRNFNKSKYPYYRIRPLCLESLIYAGLDVIDLVEVQKTQLVELQKQLHSDYDTALYIASTASYYYKREACKELMNELKNIMFKHAFSMPPKLNK